MPAKLVLYPPRRAPRFLVLRDGETLTIGRHPECHLVLEDTRVSKRHARLRWTGSGWVLEDLGSKNGSSRNGAPPSEAELAQGDWLSFGGLMARFERVAESEVASLAGEQLARLPTSLELRRRLRADLEPYDLLLRFLESALEVIGGERGFVLVAGPDGRLRTEVALGFTAEEVRGEGLAGSGSAIERVLTEGRSVVLSDARRDPVLGTRDSVVSQGVGALACVPLRHDRRLLGLVYVDSRRRASLGELDVQILEALADHLAMLIATLRLDGKIRDLLQATPRAVDPALVDALHRRVLSLAGGGASGLLAPPGGGHADTSPHLHTA